MDRHGIDLGGGAAPRDQHLEALLAPQRRARVAGAVETDLHICALCGSQLVYPTDWSQAGERHWSVQLRCPECEWHGSGIYGQELLDRFDVELDRGTEALLDDLRQLTTANMEDEIERFSSALASDRILPEDF